MNYYIQGNAAKADKIKAAFEKLGYNTKHLKFTSSQLYYTIEGEVELVCTNALQNLIKTHPDYKQLELPVEPKFKVGDWIASIDDEGDMAVERIVNLRGNKVLLVDTDGCRTEYPKTELSNFRPWKIADAKDGDVLALNGKPFIYSSHKYGKNYCYIDEWGQLRVNFSLVFEGNYVCPATKQERDLLFSKMREVGYEWNEKKKELRKIKPHYDIANFRAGMPVLVRDYDNTQWRYVQFSHCVGKDNPIMFNACGNTWGQCIPFNEKTKHLVGTTDMPSEEYINW